MIFRKTVGIYCENNTKPISKLCGKMQIFVVLQRVVHTDNLHGASKGFDTEGDAIDVRDYLNLLAKT
jgi:hypothetical protein